MPRVNVASDGIEEDRVASSLIGMFREPAVDFIADHDRLDGGIRKLSKRPVHPVAERRNPLFRIPRELLQVLRDSQRIGVDRVERQNDRGVECRIDLIGHRDEFTCERSWRYFDLIPLLGQFDELNARMLGRRKRRLVTHAAFGDTETEFAIRHWPHR